MSPELHQIFAHLADGERHNGAELAETFGVSRAAVWKRIEALRKLGLSVSGTAGSGYKIEYPVEVLDETVIRRHLRHSSIDFEVHGAVDSTNARLAARQPVPHGLALIAEGQTAGRGRRGRGWVSPLGGGIYLSLGWHFECGLSGLSPLSLVVGMAVASALRDHTGVEAMLKWPNDLVVDSAKLGGCLVEISGAAEGPCRAIVGVGLNLSLPADATVDQAFTSLDRHASKIERNRLIAAILDRLAADLTHLERHGFEPFREKWPDFDALSDRPVRVLRADGSTWDGRASGLDEHGSLRIRSRGRMHTVNAGEVSIRGH